MQGLANAHCVLLGPNYTIEKLVCPEPPIILMNPMHQPVTMAKIHSFLPRHCTVINWLPPPFKLDDFGNQNL